MTNNTPIPAIIPTATTDRGLHTFEEAGIGEMEISLEMRFTSRLDADRLAHAVRLAMDMHPVLGCRFVENEIRPWWERLPEENLHSFSVTESEEELDTFLNTPMDTLAGPQLTGMLLRTPEGDRVILKFDHHATDAGGVKEAAADIAEIYTRLATEPDFRPEHRGGAYRGELLFVRRINPLAAPYLIYNIIRETIYTLVPLATHVLVLPDGPKAPLRYCVRHIPREKTSRLAEYARSHRATLNDILNTAFLRAEFRAEPWDGRSRLRLQTTVDMRRWYMPGRAETVCNISSFEFPSLGTDIGADFSASLKRMSRFMRARKSRWPGMGKVCLIPILRILKYSKLRWFFTTIARDGAAKRNIAGTITNMGPIEWGSLSFDGVNPHAAWLLVPPVYPPMFGIGASGYNGSITLTCSTPVSALPIIEKFFDLFDDELDKALGG